jgi:hypothetical protein
MLWFGVALEDRTWRSSLSLGEHVHILHARPSVEDIYFVGFENHNLKQGASGPCLVYRRGKFSTFGDLTLRGLC